ncbi:DUF4111 domain-containing protein [Candidatus Aerophobetes bacterium]|nr:DUF4111 domain-containing protein [Candidatus Aerophobetes bacterium]
MLRQKDVRLAGYENCSKEIKNLLDSIVENFRLTLKDNLVGVYLHGSLAMGCFNFKSGDIDFLVVVKDKMDVETKKRIINFILELSRSKYVPPKGFEFSVILQRYLKDFVYPTPFELHYSKIWRKDYELGKVDYTKENEDPDLAAHITVTLNRGICLYGEPIRQIFSPITEKCYIESMLYDVKDIKDNIFKDPIYGILNLCRVLYYLREKFVSSKYEAGIWALENLPEKFKDLIDKALLSYKEGMEVEWDNEEELQKFSNYMLKRINAEKDKVLKDKK